MTEKFAPTCPACIYGLTGLIDQGSTATCPECNTQTTYEEAAVPGLPKIKQALFWLLIIPVLLTTIAWQLLLYTGSRFNNTGDMVAIVFITVQLLYIPISTYLFLRKVQLKARREKPSKRMYLTCILLFTAISTTLWTVCLSVTGTL